MTTSEINSGTVLLVEDDPEDVAWLRRAFHLAGIRNPIQATSSSEDAIRYLAGEGDYADRERHPMPILVLLGLEGRCGLKVLRWIRNQPALESLPVVVLTGTADLAPLGKARELGALTFMFKPVAPERLKARLDGVKGIHTDSHLLGAMSDLQRLRSGPGTLKRPRSAAVGPRQSGRRRHETPEHLNSA